MLIQPRKLVLEFTKMSGTGNDFIVIDNRFYHFSGDELSAMAQNLCVRRLGVGADGLLALGNPVTSHTQYRMSYYNADGTLGTMCGNGARCLARYARDAGIEGEVFQFDSDAGVYRAVVSAIDSSVRLYVPVPQRFRSDIQFDEGQSLLPGPAHFIWTGTEHVVVETEQVAEIEIARIGSLLRHDPSLKPAGANINFVQRNTDDSLTVRTFEKGVEAETLACGTGSIASAISSHIVGNIVSNPVTIHMPGGDLIVGWEGSSRNPDQLYLEGFVDVIFRATTEI